MKRRDFLAEHISSKLFIEDVMKSVAWTTLCGAVFVLSITILKSGDYFKGMLVFFAFLGVSTLSFMYVVLHIVIPLDSAMFPDDPYWDNKSQKCKGVGKIIEAIKIFITRKKFLYIGICVGYFLYANEVANYLLYKVK